MFIGEVMIVAGLVVVLLLLTYALFENKKRLKRNIVFEGINFKHTEKSKCGWVTRHYYTQGGVDLYSAPDVLHILEFNKNIVRQYWRKPLTSIISQYGLKTVGREEYEMTGSFKRLGIEMQSFGTPILMNGQENLAFYITREPKPESRKIEILNELGKLSLL